MPKVKLYVEVEVMDDKHCNGCNRKSYSSYKYTYYCELNPEYSYPLNKDKIGFLRTPECLAAEVKEEVCKWAIEYSTVKLSEVSTSCGITATWHNGIKFDFCPYCGKKVV